MPEATAVLDAASGGLSEQLSCLASRGEWWRIYDAATDLRTEAARGPSMLRFFDWAEHVRRTGLGLITGLPIVGSLPSTPTAEWRPVPHEPSDALLTFVTKMFGRAAVIEDKIRLHRIYDIYPLPSDAGSEFGSSTGPLAWHTEDAFHPLPCEWLLLFCIRGDAGARTRVVHRRNLQLSSACVQLLAERVFEFRVDESYHSAGASFRWPVLGGGVGPALRFDPAYMQAPTDDHRAAMDEMASQAEHVAEVFTLAAGDLLVFDNRRVMHSRSGYKASLLGRDRWLKRSLVAGVDTALTADGLIPKAEHQIWAGVAN